MKAVTYSRVSPTFEIKDEEGLHRSLKESVEKCNAQARVDGNDVIKDYKDQYISGKDNKKMPEFQQMMQDARDGMFEIVYSRRVNRFGRNAGQMIAATRELIELGIVVKFVESSLDTSTAVGKGVIWLMAELAEEDRKTILENTSRGREKAMAEGKKFGRTPVDVDPKEIRMYRMVDIKERKSWKDLEKRFGVSKSAMIRALKRAGYWDEKRGVVI